MDRTIGALVGAVLGLGCVWLAFRPADELREADRPRWMFPAIILSWIPIPAQRVLFFLLGLFILAVTYASLS